MIKVVQERRCVPGKEEELKTLLDELRSKVLKRDGSYARETLRSTDDPSVWLSITSWNFAEDWKAWRDCPERQEIVGKMSDLLAEPAKESVFEIVR